MKQGCNKVVIECKMESHLIHEFESTGNTLIVKIKYSQSFPFLKLFHEEQYVWYAVYNMYQVATATNSVHKKQLHNFHEEQLQAFIYHPSDCGSIAASLFHVTHFGSQARGY